jgi:hypothetical protein
MGYKFIKLQEMTPLLPKLSYQFPTAYPRILKGQCHKKDFFEGLNILISTFCESAVGFNFFQKLFTTL